MESQNQRPNHRKNIPLIVKVIILAQSATILTFTVGMYQEYMSNEYLQKYVIDILSSKTLADAMLSMVAMSVFALGTFTLLGSMGTNRRTRKDWQLLTESSNEALDMPSMPLLEVVESSSRTQKPRPNPRRRKPALDTDELFRSMVSHANVREQ